VTQPLLCGCVERKRLHIVFSQGRHVFAPFHSSVADSDVEMTVLINFASPEDDIVHSNDEECTMLPQIL